MKFTTEQRMEHDGVQLVTKVREGGSFCDGCFFHRYGERCTHVAQSTVCMPNMWQDGKDRIWVVDKEESVEGVVVQYGTSVEPIKGCITVMLPSEWIGAKVRIERVEP